MIIQRYSVIETALCIGGKVLDGEVEMVRASEHDSEMAAMREKLVKAKQACSKEFESVQFLDNENNVLQLRLTAAEQRNAELVELLTEHQWEWEPYDSHTHRKGGYYCVECQKPKSSGHEPGCKLAAALNRAESGASE